MLTVRNLISSNPFMQEENQFFLRNIALGLPAERIKDENEQINAVDIRISKVVQTTLLALQFSLRCAVNAFISTQIGSLFWNMLSIGAISGIVIGSVIGLQHSDILTAQDYFTYQSNLYACYKPRIKILEPAIEVAYWLVAYKIEILFLRIFPNLLGSISVVFTTFLYVSDKSCAISRSLKNSLSFG